MRRWRASRAARWRRFLKILFDLNARGITIIMIEHIMQAGDALSRSAWCVWTPARSSARGTPAEIVKHAEVQRAYPWRLASRSATSTPATARWRRRCTR